MSDKKRVDVALVERGLAQSREKAQALVMSGVVYIGENKVDKASTQVTPEDELIVRQTGTGYVSRGALKLEKGLAVFGVETKARVAMDLGASTGGFTDVLLQNGAAHVYAIDCDGAHQRAIPDGGRPAAQADAGRDGCVVYFDYEDFACGRRDHGRGRRVYFAD